MKDITPSNQTLELQSSNQTQTLELKMSAHSRQMNSTSTKLAARDASANADPSQGISLCIPRVFNNIGWRRIKQVFIDLRWGFVERVDVIKLGKNKRAFVHFAAGKWNTRDQQAMDALAALQRGDEVKVLYDDPWYWKISISNSGKPADAPQPRARPATTIRRKEILDLSTAATEEKVPASNELEDGEVADGNDPILARAMSTSPQGASNTGRRVVSYEGVDKIHD